MNKQLVEDVSSASAAYLWNILPSITSLPAPEAFERLKEIFETSFLAYQEGLKGWGLPDFSAN